MGKARALGGMAAYSSGHLTLRTCLSARASFLARLMGAPAVSIYSPREGPRLAASAAALSSCKPHVVHATQATYDLLRFWEFAVYGWGCGGYPAWHLASRVGGFFSLFSLPPALIHSFGYPSSLPTTCSEPCGYSTGAEGQFSAHRTDALCKILDMNFREHPFPDVG
jgi:hypothetical protein